MGHPSERHRAQAGAWRDRVPGGPGPLLDQAIGKIALIEGLLFHGSDSRPAAETQKLLQQIAGL